LPRGLARALRALAIAVLALLVLRAIALPLARQRQARRVESATLVALLPADIEAWCMERPALRRAPAALWPGEGRLRARALDWGLPLAALEADSLLRLTPFGGEWLCARRADGAWLLIGARDRLGGERARAGESPAPPLPGGYSLRLAGERFLVASDPALLDAAAPTWLAAQSTWLERDDLLLGADWLEFQAAGAGGALLGAKWVQGSLLCEGLAWDVAPEDGEARLAALCPGPAPVALPGADSLLAAMPLLRRSGPFGPDGRRLPLAAGAVGEAGGLRSGERRWRAERAAALVRVLSLR
jgi:hypothetical protein